MRMLTFLLPENELPSIEKVACLSSHAHEAYAAKPRPFFSSFTSYEPSLRLEILQITRRGFCRFGYDRMLSAQKGDDLSDEEREICRDVTWE